MAEKLLPKATAAKNSILGADYSSQIQNDMADENLPRAYGGPRQLPPPFSTHSSQIYSGSDVTVGPPTIEAILGRSWPCIKNVTASVQKREQFTVLSETHVQ